MERRENRVTIVSREKAKLIDVSEEGRESAPMRCIEIKNGNEARIIDNQRGDCCVNAIIIVHEVDAAPSEKQRKTLSVLCGNGDAPLMESSIAELLVKLLIASLFP